MAKTKKKSAKKGGRTKREITKVEHELPGGFWRQTLAVILILLAVVFVATWFGEGGSLLNEAHKLGLSALGFGVFVVPVALVFLAVKIFRAHNNRLPVVVWIASAFVILLASGLTGVFGYELGEQNGGAVGTFLNQYVAANLGGPVSVIVYIVVIFLTVIFILQMSPQAALKQMKGAVALKKKDEKKTEAEEIPKGKLGSLKINPGVAIKGAEKPAEKQPVFAVKGGKTEQAETSERALVEINDPNWKMPTIELLEKKNSPADAGNIQQNALTIKNTLAEFGLEVVMEGANIGPRVTQYTMRPPQGMNLSKISARDKELAMNLAVDKIRIEAPIPGTRSVGVEIPNVKSASVTLRSIVESQEWKNAKDPLTFAVGKDISGKAVVANLAEMPHLLIAGTTGSGKSVMTNALITSLIFRNAPSDLKLIIVDPKQVEMAQYEDIPHLLTPIITTTEKALSAMKWAAGEMDRRYNVMAEERVKKIDDYNAKMARNGTVVKKDADGNEQKHNGGKMPYIVIVIDEMADLMMRASKELEPVIVRIAQLGRAAGIHLVLATQKPVVKVITGMIKGNIPARIAFRVNTSMDSRIILDVSGAEKLLGKGDMLFLTDKMMGKPSRIQGAWAYEDKNGEGDIKNLTNFLREQRPPEYNKEVVAQQVQLRGVGPTDGGAIGDLGRRYDPNDPVVRKAVEISLAKGKFSTAMLQTYLGKGHGFVSGLAIWFEEIGVIGEANGNKPRDLLISSMEEFDKLANL
ncbi:DNA translocase FtsK 4TM domain-containing protein [Candidatus Saccharibacteria bacterium]|nr:DNA translocase FtsK 4TM domain-containing protein [Candidatus Saccharibacteria bacterium]